MSEPHKRRTEEEADSIRIPLEVDDIESAASGQNCLFRPEKANLEMERSEINSQEYYSEKENVVHSHEQNLKGLQLITLNKINFKCSYCSKVFATSQYLKNHIRSHRLPGMQYYTCKHCGRKFVHRYSWTRHLAAKHRDKPDHRHSSKSNNMNKVKAPFGKKVVPRVQCRICKIRVACKSNLLRHHKLKHAGIQIQAPVRPAKFGPWNQLKCEYCPKTFGCLSNLKCHVRIHRPPGMELYSCNICDKKFIHRGCWVKHSATHSDMKPYGCSLCGSTFKYQTSMYHHEKCCPGFSRNPAKYIRRRFKCDNCGKSFKLETNLINHKAKTNGYCKVFSCRVCKYKFYNESLFIEHEAKTHKDDGPIPCPLCGRQAKNSRALRDHKRCAHSQKNWTCTRVGCTMEPFLTRKEFRHHIKECMKPIKCSTCEQIFESNELFVAHAHPIQCQKCEKTYLKKPEMDLHLVFHDPANVDKCEYCAFGFGSSGELTMHQKMSHKKKYRILDHFILLSANNIYYFTCPFCGIQFVNPTSSVLVDHTIQSHSDKVDRFACPNCGKLFGTDKKLYSHRNKMHGVVETEFKCEPCRMFFRTKRGLQSHRNKIHVAVSKSHLVGSKNPEQSQTSGNSINSEKYRCPNCGKQCMNKTGMSQHMGVHRMDKEFKCELCVRSWTTPGSLNEHNRRCHPKVKNLDRKYFDCPRCPRKFISPNAIRSHVQKIHTKKNFLCDICGNCFSSLGRLTTHQQQYHSSLDTNDCLMNNIVE